MEPIINGSCIKNEFCFSIWILYFDVSIIQNSPREIQCLCFTLCISIYLNTITLKWISRRFILEELHISMERTTQTLTSFIISVLISHVTIPLTGKCLCFFNQFIYLSVLLPTIVIIPIITTVITNSIHKGVELWGCCFWVIIIEPVVSCIITWTIWVFTQIVSYRSSYQIIIVIVIISPWIIVTACQCQWTRYYCKCHE